MSKQEIAKRLADARQEKGASLSAAAEVTRIRRHYLQALEKGEFDLLPSAAQVRGFLRTYAAYLGLDAKEMVSLLDGDQAQKDRPARHNDDAMPQEQAAASEAHSNALFQEIGQQLRQQRETLELSYSEIEERTHIPEQYLQRLEKGEYDSFHSPTQARGMLNNYASFLGMESSAVMEAYAEGLQARFEARREAQKKQATAPKAKRRIQVPPWLRRYLSTDIIVGVVLGLGLIAFFIWGIGRIFSTRASQAAEPTAPALVDLVTPSATALEITATPAPDTGGAAIPTLADDPEEQITVEVANPGSVELRILSSRRAWMRVTIDGQLAFEGRTEPGGSYTFNAADQVLVLTGDGGSLRAFLNGQDLGQMGIEGEVVELAFTSQGVIAPTPTPSPTPTVTATPPAADAVQASPTYTVDVTPDAP